MTAAQFASYSAFRELPANPLSHKRAAPVSTDRPVLGSGASSFAPRCACGDGAPCSDVRIRSAIRLHGKQHPPCLRGLAGRPVKGPESGKRQVRGRLFFRWQRRSHDGDGLRIVRGCGRVRGIRHAERQRGDESRKERRRYEPVHDGLRCTPTDTTRTSLRIVSMTFQHGTRYRALTDLEQGRTRCLAVAMRVTHRYVFMRASTHRSTSTACEG
jgi:hypothetical protein